MRRKRKCHFFPVCGASVARQRQAEQDYLRGDPRRNYISVVCLGNDPKKHINCAYYQIRIKLLERKTGVEISDYPPVI